MQVSLATLITVGQQGDRLISMPTDTVPALACRPDAAQMIYDAKQRSLSKPLILMGSHHDDLWGYVQCEHPAFELWQQAAFWYWPGALTLVLPASDRLPHAMNPTNPTTIGLRVPNCPITRYILRHTGPLATTSVNRSGHPPLKTIEAINQEFPDVLTLFPHELARWPPSPSLNLAQLLQDDIPVLTKRSTSTPTHQRSKAQPSITGSSATQLSKIRTSEISEGDRCGHSSAAAIPINAQSPIPSSSSGTPSTVIAWTDQGWQIIRQGSVNFPGADALQT